MKRILLVALACTLCKGCYSATFDDKCEELLPLVSGLQKSRAPDSPNVESAVQELGGLSLVLRSMDEYRILAIDDGRFSWDTNVSPNIVRDSLVSDLSKGSGIEPLVFDSSWLWWEFLIEEKESVDEMTCSAPLSERKKQSLVFFAAHGGEIWARELPVEQLLLEKNQRYAVVIQATADESFRGILIQESGNQIHYTVAKYSNPDHLAAVLIGTAQENLSSR